MNSSEVSFSALKRNKLSPPRRTHMSVTVDGAVATQDFLRLWLESSTVDRANLSDASIFQERQLTQAVTRALNELIELQNGYCL